MSYFKFENKNVFYSVIGEGQPLVLIHGDTGSSKMFEMLLPLYTNDFQVIMIDFLGNGSSDRVESFPANMYEWQAEQVIALLEYLHIGKVSLLGTSGGAWVAINTALKREDFIDKIIADSFDGRSFADDFAEQLVEARERAKTDVNARQFYEWCQGSDWETIVDLNTNALLSLAKSKYLFCNFLENLKVPLLLIGSKEDEMCREDLEEEYRYIDSVVSNTKIILFETGNHPCMLSNAIKVYESVKDFLL